MSSFNIGQRSQSMPNLAEIQKSVAAREARKTQSGNPTQLTGQIQQTQQTQPNLPKARLQKNVPQKTDGLMPENLQPLIMSKSIDALLKQAQHIDEVPELQGMLEEFGSECLSAAT